MVCVLLPSQLEISYTTVLESCDAEYSRRSHLSRDYTSTSEAWILTQRGFGSKTTPPDSIFNDNHLPLRNIDKM